MRAKPQLRLSAHPSNQAPNAARFRARAVTPRRRIESEVSMAT